MEDCKLVEDQECTIVDDVELEEVCENMDKGRKFSKAVFLAFYSPKNKMKKFA